MAGSEHLSQIDFIMRFFMFFHACLRIPSYLIWLCLIGMGADGGEGSHIMPIVCNGGR